MKTDDNVIWAVEAKTRGARVWQLWQASRYGNAARTKLRELRKMYPNMPLRLSRYVREDRDGN